MGSNSSKFASSFLGVTYSVPAPSVEEAKGETPPYRFAGLKPDEKLNDCLPNGDQDLNKALENAVKEFANNPCLGTRKMTEETKIAEDGKEETGKCSSVFQMLTSPILALSTFLFSPNLWKIPVQDIR